MSAVIVLILRGLMTLSLYLFLVFSLIYFLREMQHSIHQKENQHTSGVFLKTEGLPAKFFSKMEILIGRNELNDLQLEDDTISARHARIFFSKNHWMLEDSQSTNGTYLNDEKLISPTVLVENDIIRCGKIMIKVAFQKQP
jgi:hypothetical protein